jgi:hypothetical protein
LCPRSQHDKVHQPPIYEAKMSLQHAAKHLEKHGRNGDTVLVHMSKGEVKSLNDLAMAGGGHLTINPHTGLPEAGFLQRMLPVVIGAGLSAAGVPPPIAAAMVGGGYYAKTGSVKQGLMAGLGAYGGAGMGASFGEAGAASVAPEAAAAPEAVVPATPPAPIVDASNYVKPPVFETAPINPNPTVVDAAGNVTQTAPIAPQIATPAPLTGTGTGSPMGGIGYRPSAIAPEIATPAPLTGAGSPMGGIGYRPPAPVAAPPVAPPPPVAEAAPETFSTNPADYENFKPGVNKYGAFGEPPTNIDFKNMTASQRLEAMKSGASWDNLGDWASKNKVQAYGAGASALMPWDEENEERKPYRDSDPGQQYTYEANATSPTPTYDPSGREQKYFNQRYVARAADGGMMASGGISDAHYNLGGYSDGGRLLRGPGDGVSDSIPAVIGKKQPARLADGEFVVPARIVSELGNGSTEAGARKLYAMMDRIQKARGKTVGKGKVAKNSRADKYLPA